MSIRFAKQQGGRMPRDYDEKRDFIRVEVDTEIKIRVSGLDEEAGRVKNLSGRGMMFISENELEKESVVEVQISSEDDIAAPLHANVRVVRVAKQRRGNGYEIGAVIQEMLDE